MPNPGASWWSRWMRSGSPGTRSPSSTSQTFNLSPRRWPMSLRGAAWIRPGWWSRDSPTERPMRWGWGSPTATCSGEWWRFHREASCPPTVPPRGGRSFSSPTAARTPSFPSISPAGGSWKSYRTTGIRWTTTSSTGATKFRRRSRLSPRTGWSASRRPEDRSFHDHGGAPGPVALPLQGHRAYFSRGDGNRRRRRHHGGGPGGDEADHQGSGVEIDEGAVGGGARIDRELTGQARQGHSGRCDVDVERDRRRHVRRIGRHLEGGDIDDPEIGPVRPRVAGVGHHRGGEDQVAERAGDHHGVVLAGRKGEILRRQDRGF